MSIVSCDAWSRFVLSISSCFITPISAKHRDTSTHLSPSSRLRIQLQTDSSKLEHIKTMFHEIQYSIQSGIFIRYRQYCQMTISLVVNEIDIEN